MALNPKRPTMSPAIPRSITPGRTIAPSCDRQDPRRQRGGSGASGGGAPAQLIRRNPAKAGSRSPTSRRAARRAKRSVSALRRAAGQLPDCGVAHHRGIVAIGDDQPAGAGMEAFLLERLQVEPGRHRPEEAVAIIEIVTPFAVANQIGAETLISTMVIIPARRRSPSCRRAARWAAALRTARTDPG